MKIPQFLGGTDEQRSKNLSDNKLINLYPVTNNDGSVSALYKVEGLKEEATLSGIPSGAYKTTTNRAFYVSGTTLYELNSDLTSTSRGTLTAGTYSFSDNGIELICVNGTNGWLFTLATNTLTQIKVLTDNFTVAITDSALFTKASHGLSENDRIVLSTTGSFPSGLSANTVYYVIASGLTTDNFRLSETAGGSALNLTVDAGFTVVMSASFTYAGLLAVDSGETYFEDGRTRYTRMDTDYPLGTEVEFIATGTLPTGLSTNTSYYITGPENITVSTASPAVVTFTLTTPVNGTLIRLYSAGELPTGLSIDTDYYIVGAAGATCNLSLTSGGAAINTTAAGSGNVTFMFPAATTPYCYLASSTSNIFGTRVSYGVAGSGTIKIVKKNSMPYGTNTFTTLGYGFPEGCTTVSYMNGRFIACEPNTQNFYVSEVLDGWYWDALNVQTVDSNPDYVTAQVVSHNECIVFCEYSGEVFYDSGSLPSPFVRNQSGIFEVGCNAPFSISVLDNSIFWLGQSKEGDGIVYRLNGYTPTRISTYSIEQTIKSFTTKTDAKAFSYQLEGHHFYVLTFPTEGKTFVYDANTNLWHERASFISSAFGRWEANDFLYFNGVQYVTDYNSTKLYSLDVDTYSNGSNPIKVVRSFRTPQADLNRVPHNRLMLDAEVGTVGINESEPQIMMRWSDDLGYTWSNLKTKGLGAVGEYFKRVTFNRLGATKGQPRVYELSSTSDAKIVLLNVYIE